MRKTLTILVALTVPAGTTLAGERAAARGLATISVPVAECAGSAPVLLRSLPGLPWAVRAAVPARPPVADTADAEDAPMLRRAFQVCAPAAGSRARPLYRT